MLRLLQEQRFERIGGNETIRTDVRLLAATNQNLDAFIAQGKFRSDLYYRLGVFTIRLPPLRERGDDLMLLIQHYLRRFNGELGKNVQGVAPETLVMLQRYSWPGNLRELQSVIKQALLQATGPVLMPDFLPADLRQKCGEALAAQASPDEWPGLRAFVTDRLAAGTDNLYKETLRRVERQLFTQVLEQTKGSQLQAARILGISRANLYGKLRALGISTGRSKKDRPTDEGLVPIPDPEEVAEAEEGGEDPEETI
jgi:two-component system nitrogen regulation response regulator GlnG